MSKCCMCKIEQTKENTGLDLGRATGFRSKCKKCNKQYMQKYHMQFKIISNNLKLNGCAICGYNKCMDCLEFHHSNPKDKKFGINIRNIEKRNNIKIAEELNKCILLCNRCHREKHSGV